ncbi:cytochrome P450 [Pseudovirgaria hyperparasitica]|uniref:Cytochrome P450 n=1 Tax=Pseudovirgaria hyperparasitica TaxID=470096 RepID=A0A6A6VXF9_9PEZI|nr:cytochrome P450 [Pseudovirgaria hyperparasitica]KAF2755292.1 cytochrome P450 [Pseudovirgaria hyperparasitica]
MAIYRTASVLVVVLVRVSSVPSSSLTNSRTKTARGNVLIYGPIIRVSPHEVHIVDLEFLDTIYSSSKARNKDPWRVKTLDVAQSVGDSADHELHRRRRASLVPFFSKPAVSKIERVIKQKLYSLHDVFDVYKFEGRPINLCDLYFGFTQDIVKNYCFGHDEELISDMGRAKQARNQLTTFMMHSHINVHFGWINRTLRKLPAAMLKFASPGLYEFQSFAKKLFGLILLVLDEQNKTTANRSDGHAIPTLFHELRDSNLLPAGDKTATRLLNEAILIVTAGSESLHKSLFIIHYHLLDNPDVLRKLRAELRLVAIDASWNDLERLPYLTAVIAEGNRLNFGLTGRNSRNAPHEDLKYGEYVIPAGTPMSTMSMFVNCNEELYPDPWTFRPERWLDGVANERRKFMMSFGKGARRCLGVNLAHMIMYKTIAKVSTYNLDLYQTDARDVIFLHEYMTAQPRLDSKGVRAVVKDTRYMDDCNKGFH